MKRKIIFSFIFIFLIKVSFSQSERQRFYGLYFGYEYIDGKIENKNLVRGIIPSTYSSSSTDDLYSYTQEFHIGAKIEYRALSNWYAAAVGFQFMRLNSGLGKSFVTNDATKYYHFLYQQQGLETHYLRIKEMNEVSNYFGVPIEFKVFVYRPYLWRLYIKARGDINFRISNNRDVVFFNNEMEKYEDDVLGFYRNSSAIYSALYIGPGFRIGRPENPIINIEIFTTIFLTKKFSSYISPYGAGGFQVNMQVPF